MLSASCCMKYRLQFELLHFRVGLFGECCHHLSRSLPCASKERHFVNRGADGLSSARFLILLLSLQFFNFLALIHQLKASCVSMPRVL